MRTHSFRRRNHGQKTQVGRQARRKISRARKAAAPETAAEFIAAAPAGLLAPEAVAAPAELLVGIDYPQQDEGISSRQYTFRLGVNREASKIEVSIDRGPWMACRQAAGYWWFDWTNYQPGVHRVTARALGTDGTAGISVQRRFQVIG